MVGLAVTVPLSKAELDASRTPDGTYWLPAKLLNTRARVERQQGWER